MITMLALALIVAPPQDTPSRARKPQPIDPMSWIDPNADPRVPVAAGGQVTSFQLDVDMKGNVTGCTITQSSGSAPLDEQTCAFMTKNGHFKPALDDAGKPVASTWRSRFRWMPR